MGIRWIILYSDKVAHQFLINFTFMDIKNGQNLSFGSRYLGGLQKKLTKTQGDLAVLQV